MTLTALLALSAVAKTGDLTVFAAASLKDAFTSIAREFEVRHPGVKVRLSFAGSQQLAAQIQHGAPADVFASAALVNLKQTGYEPKSLRTFARNRLVVVVPAASGSVKSLGDLTRAKRLVLAAPAVPAGRYAQTMLALAGKGYGARWVGAVRANVVSLEQDVRAVLTKVVLGEADAGIVYVTDAMSAGTRVRQVPIDPKFNPAVDYPIALLTSSTQKDLGRAFIAAVMSKAGQAELKKAGFLSGK